MRFCHLVLVVGIALAGSCLAGAAQEAPADLLFEYAEGLYRDGLHKLAVPELDKFLKAHPKDLRATRAWFYLGECRYALKDYKAALPAFEAAARDAKLPQLPVALYRTGDCRFRLGAIVEAIAPLEQFLATKLLTPDHRRFIVHAKYVLARAYFHQRRFDGALKLYQEVLTDPSPDNTYKAHVLRPIGDCQLALGQADPALSSYRQLETYLEAAIKQKKKDDPSAAAQRKFLDELRLRMAGLLLKQQKHAEALAKFGLLAAEGAGAEEIIYGRAQCLYYLARYQESLVPALAYLKRFAKGQHVLDALYIAGEAYHHTGRYPEAEKYFGDLLARDTERKHPAREAAAWGRCYADYRQGEPHAKAIAAAADAFMAEFAKSRHVPDVHYFRAEAAYWLKDYARAVDHYRNVPAANPNAEEAVYKVAMCLDLLERQEAAAAAYDTYLGKYLDKGRHYKEAVDRAARLWGRLGKYDKAAERYGAFAKRFAKTDPKKAEEYLYRKGACEFESKQFERMYATFRAYFETYPEGKHKGDVLYFMAWYHSERKQQYEIAVQLFELSANIPGKFALEALYQLALTHNRIAKKLLEGKDKKQADQHFLQAATIFLTLMRKHPELVKRPDQCLWAAEVFREQGKLHEAIAAYEALIARHPKEASEPVIYWLGQLSLKLEPPDYKRAETYFRRFTGQFKEHAYFIWAGFGLAEALKGAGKDKEARDEYQKVQKLAPHVVANAVRRDALLRRCRLQMGRIDFDSKQYEYARENLLRVGYLAVGEEAAEALYKAGVAAFRLKDEAPAVTIWNKLLRDHPKSPWTKKLLDELSEFRLRLSPDGKTIEPVPGAGAEGKAEPKGTEKPKGK